MTLRVGEALRAGAERLAGIAGNPRLEARLLLAHALGVTTSELLRERARAIDPAGFEALLARRLRHEPLALITGQREFWSMDFLVSPDTLIPRPDSETLVEAALQAFRGRGAPRRILDLGTGTGCLLLALLHEFPVAFGVGVDIVPAAAALARANAARLGLAGRAAFVAADWDGPLAGRFELVVSNPPYIAEAERAELMPEVAWFEPRSALDGGPDGCAAYRTLIARLPALLQPDGVAVLELGAGQDEAVEILARRAGFERSLRFDLGKIPRALVLSRPGGPKNRLADPGETYTVCP